MNRRRFIRSLSSIGVLTAVGGGIAWYTIDEYPYALTFDSMESILDSFKYQKLETSGEWNIAQILEHCAQSIEFSMNGFPEHKSEHFKNIIGTNAFSVFAKKKRMTHPLSEPIPGAEKLSPDSNYPLALNRLKKAIFDFRHYSGELAPHFTYGALSKKDYEIAHTLHFYNHMEEIKPT